MTASLDKMFYLKFVNMAKKKEMRSGQITRAFTIGRGPSADISFEEDTGISRLHTLVIPRPDNRVELRDLCSATGTFISVKGEKIRVVPGGGKVADKGRAILNVGDIFYIGSYKIELCHEEVMSELSWRQKFHEAIDREWDDITGVDKIEDL